MDGSPPGAGFELVDAGDCDLVRRIPRISDAGVGGGPIVLFPKQRNTTEKNNPGPTCRPADRRPDDAARGNNRGSMNSSDSLGHP